MTLEQLWILDTKYSHIIILFTMIMILIVKVGVCNQKDSSGKHVRVNVAGRGVTNNFVWSLWSTNVFIFKYRDDISRSGEMCSR